MLQQELPKRNNLPTLIQLYIHQVAIKHILRYGFLHKRLEGTNLTTFRVEIEFLEPTVDELGEARVFGLLVQNEEFIDLTVKNCAKDLDEDAGDRSAALDPARVNVIRRTLLNKRKESGSKIVHHTQVDFLMLPFQINFILI